VKTSDEHRLPVLTDRAIWQTSASLVGPVVIIGGILKTSTSILEKYAQKISFRNRQLAFASVVPVVYLVDHATDYVMDKITRRLPFF